MQYFSRLDELQCERLHDATLRVLDRTGLIVDEPEGLELLRLAGARVDGNVVRIGGDLVDWALASRPGRSPSTGATASRRCAAAATSAPSAPAATACIAGTTGRESAAAPS
jgi:trimethylamine:corrinoid methyltransferase-like protein